MKLFREVVNKVYNNIGKVYLKNLNFDVYFEFLNESVSVNFCLDFSNLCETETRV